MKFNSSADTGEKKYIKKERTGKQFTRKKRKLE